MQRFILRRLVFIAVSILGATLFVFVLTHMARDPRELWVPQGGWGASQEQWERWGRELGFDKPLVVQYFLWLGRMLKGDLGRTLAKNTDVAPLVASRIGATATLALGAWLWALMVGIPIGVLSAVKRGTLWDYVARTFALFGQALPAFWVGIIAIWIFAAKLDLLPAGGKAPSGIGIKYYILPCITLGWHAAANQLRFVRSGMLEILDSEFIKFARAKGVREWVVIWKHAFKNAMIPPLTSALVILAGFITGNIVVEVVFTWPGLGRLMMDAIWTNDYPILIGCVLVYVCLFAGMAFLADVLYAYIDPRIRYG